MTLRSPSRARRLAVALTALLAGAPTAFAALDRIVAVVNDDVITQSELELRLADTRRKLAAERIASPGEAALTKQLLDRLVVEQLQLQYAERAGLRVSDTDLEHAIENIARRNNLAPEEFQRRIKSEGMDFEAFRAQIRNQLLIEQLVEREVRNRVNVSEAEIEAFLEAQQGRAAVNTEYQLSHIFLGVPESASPAAIQAARARAEELLAQLRNGADFQQLAVAHSQAPDALQGGAIGWRKAGQLPDLFLAALKQMQPGDVSEVLRSPNGFHLLKLNDRRGEAEASAVTQTHVRHILMRPSEILSQEEARAKLLGLRERIEHGEDFAALARAHSEDAASAANGGDLGWSAPGQFVPEFERAMEALRPGETSKPVQTPFGWHLIQVLERRSHEAREERQRAQARSQIGARKADERYQQWIRQLRDEAFVELLLEEAN
jgi:peptidyl-prolyl cis-trans isomerase SurA